MSQFKETILEAQIQGGVYVYLSNNILIDNNSIVTESATGVGLDILESPNNTISNNTITNTNATKTNTALIGIFLQSSNSTTIDNNTIGTSPTDSYLDCIRLNTTNSSTIKNNTLQYCWNGLEYPSMNGHGVYMTTSCENNNFYNNYLLESSILDSVTSGNGGNKYNYNILKNAHVNGIDFRGGSTVNASEIHNNTVIHHPSGTAGHGIDIQISGKKVSIKNNIITCDVSGANIQCVSISGPYTSVEIDNNLYQVTNGSMLGSVGGASYSTLDAWRTAMADDAAITLKDANSAGGDPLFVSAGTDFHLTSLSPAINSGVDVGLTSDYAGTLVPQGLTPDMGAYEYIPLTVTIEQEVGQSDPTDGSTINFTVVFSESVSDFATGDVTLSGTAGATTATVTGSGTTYNVAVSGMTDSGTVIASIDVDKATGATSNTNSASTSTDNSVTYDISDPVISVVASTPNSTGATITWTTDEDSSSKVDYGLTDSYGSTTTESDTSPRVSSHTVELTGITACTTYHYRVRSTDALGNEGVGTDSTFITTGCSSSSNSSNSSSSSSSSSSAPSCDKSAPSSATLLWGATTKDTNSVLLQFGAASDPFEHYALEFGTESGKYLWGATTIGDKNTREYLVKSLSPNTTYYFRIRAGNGCAAGDWSQEISTKTWSYVSFNNLEITDSELVAVKEEQATTPSCQTYTVKSGDSLWQIASSILGDGNKYKEIIEQNKIEYPSLETSNSVSAGWELKVNCDGATASNQETAETEQESGYDVKVKVVDTDKKPVEGAKVTIHSKVQEAITDKDGVAKFTNVESGDHKVLIAYKNYEGEQSVNLTGDVKEFALNVTIEQKPFSLSPLAYGIIGVLVIVIVLLILRLRTRK